jgi:hypothetical protein
MKQVKWRGNVVVTETSGLDAMWEGSDRKPDWSKTGLAHSFSPKEHANGYA